MSDLAEAVLPLIRTRADLHRWSASNEHGRQMHQAVTTLEQAADTEDPAALFAVTQKAIASALKVIMRADDSSGIIGDACRSLLDLHPKAAAAALPSVGKLVDWMVAFQFVRGKCDRGIRCLVRVDTDHHHSHDVLLELDGPWRACLISDRPAFSPLLSHATARHDEPEPRSKARPGRAGRRFASQPVAPLGRYDSSRMPTVESQSDGSVRWLPATVLNSRGLDLSVGAVLLRWYLHQD